MKILLLLSLMIASLTTIQKAHADPYTGLYKIALVDVFTEVNEGGEYTYGDGLTGRLRVFKNKNGVLRLSGWVYDYYFEERTSLRGRVKSNGEVVVSPLPDGVDSLELKIIKRNKVVVGLTGNGTGSGSEDEYSWTNLLKFTGYKIKNLKK